MRFVSILALAGLLGMAGMAAAQTQTIDFETGYSPGSIVGQQSWTVQTGNPGNFFVVDNTVFSPMNGSRQSLKLGGGPTVLTRVWTPLATNIVSGVWRVGYDFRYTGQAPGSTTGLFMTVTLYDQLTNGTQQIFQPYAQDYDGGAPGGAYQNGFTCAAPMAGGYGGRDLRLTAPYNPNQWYRFEFVMDLDQGLIMDLTIYDISSGTKVQIANNPGTFYNNNNGTLLYNKLTAIGLRFDPKSAADGLPADANEAWWADNIRFEPTTLPAPKIGAPPLYANQNVPFSKALSLVAPQPVTWSLVSGPAGAVIDPKTGTITGWTPATPGSTASFTAKATNTHGASDTKTFAVTVIGQYELARIPFDAQIDAGAGPAITPVSQWLFQSPDEQTPDNFGRYLLQQGFGANSYWNVPVDFRKAGFGDTIDLSSCYTRMDVDLRYYHEVGVGAGMGAFFYDVNGKKRAVTWFHSETNEIHYPQWQHHTIYLNNPTMFAWDSYWNDADFDPTKVYMMEWFGTDWDALGNDFFDCNNLVITNQPVAPVLAAVTPDPHAAFATAPYAKQMVVTPCPDVTWTLVPNGTGATIDNAGLVSGWTPTVGQIGRMFTFTVNATGPGGTASTTWKVKVMAPQVADSGLDTPWATIHANSFGTQSSDDPRLTLSKNWSVGLQVDWTLNVPTANSLARRASDRTSIVFDNAGNLYWKGSGDASYLCSASPTGTLRWISNAIGTPLSLGGSDTTTPVVGDGQRVYVVTDTGVAAFNKDDGEQIWSTDLPDCKFAGNGDRLTPVLYNGKLYAVSSSQPGKKVYQVDSLTGVLDWSSAFEVNIDTGWGEMKGQMCFVPDALGAGTHGLYFNGDAGGSGQGMYCLAIDPASGATLRWSDKGGKVARSHVIYMASSRRVCTATWNDYGASFYTWNLDGTKPATAGGNPAASGHGDFGAVDFDGNDLIAGGFDGRIVRAIDVAEPNIVPPGPLSEVLYSTAFEDFALGDAAGQKEWQLDNWGSITASPQIVNDPTGTGHGRVLALQPPGNDTSGWQGVFKPLTRTRQIVTMEWDQWRQDTKDYVGVADEFRWWSGWYADQNGGNIWAAAENGTAIPLTTGQWQHVRYTFDMLVGVVTVDVDGTVATTTMADKAIDAFDIQMGPTAAGDGGPLYLDNLVIKQGDPDPSERIAFAGTGWYQTDTIFGEPRGTGGLYKDENGKSIYIAGTSDVMILGFNVTDSVMYTDAPPGTPDPAQNEPLVFQYDTATTDWPSGGPVLGPAVAGVRQHIYFFPGGSDMLVALTYLRPIPGDFNGDRMVDLTDLNLFVACAAISGPTVPIADPNCAKCDLDGDKDIDQSDFGVFQKCYRGTSVPGDPDCAN